MFMTLSYHSDKNSDKQLKRKKQEPSSHFQRHRVDILLVELEKRFPVKITAPPKQGGRKKDKCISSVINSYSYLFVKTY